MVRLVVAACLDECWAVGIARVDLTIVQSSRQQDPGGSGRSCALHLATCLRPSVPSLYRPALTHLRSTTLSRSASPM